MPTFDEPPWLGYYAHNQGKTVQVTVSTDGLITVSPLKKGEARPYLKLPFKFSIRRKLSNGRTRILKVNPASLKSQEKPVANFREITITGEAGEGATFEMTVQFSRETVSLTGMITSTGEELKSPLGFYFQTKLGHFHGRLMKRVKKDQRKFDAIVGKDWFELRRHDDKKIRRHLTDSFYRENVNELNGPGAHQITVQAAIIDKEKRHLVFKALGASKLTIDKKKDGPYHKGYFIEWTPDLTLKKSGEAKLTFSVKKS